MYNAYQSIAKGQLTELEIQMDQYLEALGYGA
jgi:hypothetical protein